MQFTDYNAEAIAAKLKQVEDFEAKYGSNNLTISWYKWCTDYEYRKREWQWRQNLAKAHEELTHKPIRI